MFFDESHKIKHWPNGEQAENCPFCDAFPVGISYSIGANKSWACGTSLDTRTDYDKTPPEKVQVFNRANPCYEREISQLKAMFVTKL